MPESRKIREAEFLSREEELELWRLYQRNAHTAAGRKPLDRLMAGHDRMLRGLAESAYLRYPHLAERADYLQHARLGYLVALARFNEAKAAVSGTSLTTYVFRTVAFYLMSVVDDESPIRVNNHNRDARSYLNGNYDHQPARKAAFERKHRINNDEDRHAFQQQMMLLVAKFMSLDGLVNPNEDGESIDTQDSLLMHHQVEQHQLTEIATHLRMDIERAMESLTERQKLVIKLVHLEGKSHAAVAELLNITKDKVRSDLRASKRKMKEYFAGMYDHLPDKDSKQRDGDEEGPGPLDGADELEDTDEPNN